MRFLTPLIKTIIISSVLFFVLVYLGMKYHWVGFYQDDGKIPLILPNTNKTLGTNINHKNNQVNPLFVTGERKSFQPQIIQITTQKNPAEIPQIVDMTKAQVTQNCANLLSKKINDSEILQLAIGNCVISNYRESLIAKRPTNQAGSEVKSTKNRQAQIQKNNRVKACNQRINSKNISDSIEKQLLLGICLSETAR